MNAELHVSPQRQDGDGREGGVSWLEVGCAWLAVIALVVLALAA